MEEQYTIKEVAIILKSSYETVYKKVVLGEIDGAWQFGKCWRIPKSSLEEYRKQNTI